MATETRPCRSPPARLELPARHQQAQPRAGHRLHLEPGLAVQVQAVGNVLRQPVHLPGAFRLRGAPGGDQQRHALGGQVPHQHGQAGPAGDVQHALGARDGPIDPVVPPGLIQVDARVRRADRKRRHTLEVGSLPGEGDGRARDAVPLEAQFRHQDLAGGRGGGLVQIPLPDALRTLP